MRRYWLFSLVFLCYIKSNAQIVEKPVFDRTDTPAFRVEKVEMTPDTTYVYCTYHAEAGSWANISNSTFIRDVKTKKKYPLVKCDGLPFGPQKRYYGYDELCNVLLCFPSLSVSSKFDLIESENEKAFNIYGIDILSKYDISYNDSEINRFSNLASFYESVEDTIKALQFKAKEIEATKFVYGINSEPLIAVLLKTSVMLDNYGFYSQAIDWADLAGKKQAELWGTNNWNYALHLRTLGQFYSHANDYKMAIKKFEDAINVFESLDIIDNEYALTLRFLSDNYSQINDFDKAIVCQRKCIKARKTIGNADLYVEELLNTLFAGTDNKDIINNRIQIVTDELNNLPSFVDCNSYQFAEIFRYMGMLYNMIGKYEDANIICNKALEILVLTDNSKTAQYAELLAFKCKCLQQCGKKYEAIEMGELAKELFEELNMKSLKYAELLDDLASAYGLALNYEKSIKMLISAAEIYQNAKDWLSLVEVYGCISDYYKRSENPESSERYIKDAINILNAHDNAEQYIMDQVELTGNRFLSRPSTLAAINFRININKSNLYQTLASIYYKQEKYEEAIKVELEHGQVIKSINDDEMFALHLMSLSEYYLKNNQYSDAIASAEHGCQLYTKDNRLGHLLKLQLAFICFQVGDTAKAIQYAEDAVSGFKSLGENEDKITAQSLLSFFYYKNHNYMEAEKCLADVLDLLVILVSKELIGMTTEQKQRLWNKYETSFIAYRNIIEKSDRNAAYLSKLYDYVLFSKNLLLDTENKDNTGKLKITWKDIQKKMADDDIAIEFISTIEESTNYSTYHALVIDKKNIHPNMITLYSESKLFEEIKRKNTSKVTDIVGELIWKPILDHYKGVRNIYFSPDGILHMLPIEYYKVDSLCNIFDSYNMYRLSSTKELVEKHDLQKYDKAILYGGLDYNQLKETSLSDRTEVSSNYLSGIAERGGFDPLYNTLIETREIKDLLLENTIKSTLYTGEDGTEESFRNLSSHNINIIHLATHGMYISSDEVETKKNKSNFSFLESLSNPNNPVKEDVALTHSFLVMSGGNRIVNRAYNISENNDGILTSKEISQLDLRGLDLVVLSACESAMGDVEYGGVYGLQRGFKKAGAKTILMSLYKVDDEATKILMVAFYKCLMSGKTKRESLKNAQKYLRRVDNGKYDKPEYWASFIMLDGLN